MNARYEVEWSCFPYTVWHCCWLFEIFWVFHVISSSFITSGLGWELLRRWTQDWEVVWQKNVEAKKATMYVYVVELVFHRSVWSSRLGRCSVSLQSVHNNLVLGEQISGFITRLAAADDGFHPHSILFWAGQHKHARLDNRTFSTHESEKSTA